MKEYTKIGRWRAWTNEEIVRLKTRRLPLLRQVERMEDGRTPKKGHGCNHVWSWKSG